ncbi:MAG: HAD-IB family phosphatase [Candidatus Aenigmatarchaeota archaeon]
MYKMLVLDMEPAVLNGEGLVLLAREVGLEKEVTEITNDGLAGKIDWETGLRKRIDLLRGTRYSIVKRVFDNMPYTDGIKEVFAYTRQNGILTAIVTGGFDIQAQRIKKEFGIDYLAANELVFRNGRLDGVTVHVNHNKHEHVDRFKRDAGIIGKVLVVGDGKNDLTMIQREHGVGINTVNEAVKRACRVQIYHPIQLIDILRNPESYLGGAYARY